MTPRLSSNSRIALVRPDRIGDCVLASAAIRDVLAAHPRAEVFWVVREEVAPLFSGPDFPATLVTFREDEPVESLALRLGGLKLNAIAHLNPHPLTEAAAQAAGIPARAGVKSSGGPGNLTVALGCNKDEGHFHEADYGRQVINLLRGFEVSESLPSTPCLSPAREAREEAVAVTKNLLQDDGTAAEPFAVIHPGAHGVKARLPHRVFQDLALHLVKTHRLRLVMVGAKAGPEDLPAGMIPDLLDLRGKLSLGASAHLLQAAAVVISRDSGPAHIAAALGAPTVCIFPDLSPWATPRRWMPLGPNVRAVTTTATPRWYEKFKYDWYRRRAAGAVSTPAVLAAADALLD
jgi:ADP-heptose:LPS heptosyltransferase